MFYADRVRSDGAGVVMTDKETESLLRDDPAAVAGFSESALRDILARAGLGALRDAAAALREAGHGKTVSYSRKVFVPLTHLCRDVCHYCTFARPPRRGETAYLTPEQVLSIARAGERQGCKEVLFTLGDKPELRYGAARQALADLGHATTVDYLAAMCALVLRETTLLPHVNPGVLDAEQLNALRAVSVSQGIMLESASDRLCQRGGPHFGSPDKRPAARLETIRLAGEAGIPLTSGILIGIGETRGERIDALLALRDLHRRYGHIQEIIVQNFRAKPGTRMADATEPDLDDLAWTIAATRLIFGAHANIQAPPNLSAADYPRLLGAGLNDWGGVSPVTPDHVNPEAPWPLLDDLRARTEAAGHRLVERLALYPSYCSDVRRWVDRDLATRVIRATDSSGFARAHPWSPGQGSAPPDDEMPRAPVPLRVDPALGRVIDKASDGGPLTEDEIVRLFGTYGPDYDAVCAAADELRASTVGDTVTYVVNRNINYTNMCSFRCRFCAFAKGAGAASPRDVPYDLSIDEVVRRATEAWQRGATEVCMQGGIHPDYTGETYVSLCRAVKEAVSDMHIHAFSPLEVSQGAQTVGKSVAEFLSQLKGVGLGTLPGTAAEILDDEVRAELCPDKVRTGEWLAVMEAAHGLGLRTTSTIMFGHMEPVRSWARHLIHIRNLQARTGGFTEFVPLPFVHMEAPIYRAGGARKGPTFRETVLMHAVARLVLHPLIPNIQVSWVKLGEDGARACLQAGANDLGGTLMNESISRAAGAGHGQEMSPERMESLIGSLGREPRQRTTLYGPVVTDRRRRSLDARALDPVVLTPSARRRATAEVPRG
jgi:FO synthase